MGAAVLFPPQLSSQSANWVSVTVPALEESGVLKPLRTMAGQPVAQATAFLYKGAKSRMRDGRPRIRTFNASRRARFDGLAPGNAPAPANAATPGNGVSGNGIPGNGKPGNGKPGNGKPGNGKPGNANERCRASSA